MAPHTADPASGSAAEVQVPGREPDPIPWCKHQGLIAVTVCAHFLAQHGALKMDMSSVPCLLSAPEPVVHRRSLGLTLMSRIQNRLLEGGEVCGGVAERVLGHLCPGHERRPLRQPVLAIRPQKPTHILVNSLHLPLLSG